MPYFRYIAVAMLFSLLFPAGCGSSRNKALQDPVARSGTSSEDIWYQYGGARVAYTSVARPKQLHTGYASVMDPALYGQAPTTTKVPSKQAAKPKPKAAAAPPRDPNCPPCPPADATNSPPPTPSPQASPALPPPAQSAASPAPPAPATSVPGATAAAAPPPSPPRMPLPGMPAATPAPTTPKPPAR